MYRNQKYSVCSLTRIATVVARVTTVVSKYLALEQANTKRVAIGDGAQPKCGRCEHARKPCVYETGRRFRRSSIQETFSESQPWVSMPPRSMESTARRSLGNTNSVEQFNFWMNRMRSVRSTRTKCFIRFIALLLYRAFRHKPILL